jgi:hypothetical protein
MAPISRLYDPRNYVTSFGRRHRRKRYAAHLRFSLGNTPRARVGH